MLVARLAKRAYADLSGNGAAISGGRWNSKGKPMVYTASCGALATVEYLAHLSFLPSSLMMMYIDIPDTLKIEKVKSVPADPAAFLQIGNEWLDSKSTSILEVPSVLVPNQKNYLINPQHPLLAAIVIREVNPFAFDSRLLSSIAPSP